MLTITGTRDRSGRFLRRCADEGSIPVGVAGVFWLSLLNPRPVAEGIRWLAPAVDLSRV